MNKVTVAVGAGALAAVLAGCGPELAQTSYGEKEAEWQRVIRENYPQYEPPRTAPPAVRDNVSPRLLEEEQRMRQEGKDDAALKPASGAPDASEDPEVTVDRAAEKTPAADGAAMEKDAPAKDGKAAPAKAEKAAPEKVSGETYVVKSGDTLGSIARKFYGDARNSDVILRANPQLTDPNRLRIGTSLVIPKI